MTPETVQDVARLAIETVLLVSGPMLILSLIIGLTISAFQAMTSLNEMTLTFVPKIVAVFMVLLLGFPWLLKVYLGFMTTILGNIPSFIR